ncbi:GAF domain-containing protein [Alcaligenaceae bacterium C4P045]|nr:GAF domain-containing protein [Alcaligenaceae bacterium C4P045]
MAIPSGIDPAHSIAPSDTLSPSGADCAMAALHVFSAAVGGATRSHEVWPHLMTACREMMRVRFLSVLLFAPEAGTLTRLYSSDPETYPIGGEKRVDQTPASQRALTSRTPFLANDLFEVERFYGDAQQIAAMGCGSVLNVPVHLFGTAYGSINVLGAAGAFSSAHVAYLTIIAQMCTLPMRQALTEQGTRS